MQAGGGVDIYSPARRVFRGSSSLQTGGVVVIFVCKKSLQRLLQPAAGGVVDIFFCKKSLQRLLQPAVGGGVDIFSC